MRRYAEAAAILPVRLRTLALSLACRYLHAPMALISEQDYAGYEKLALALAGTFPALEHI